MGIRYPGSNMQELNLDWVLSTVKENTEKVDTQLHDLTELEEKVDNAVYSVDHMTVEAETLQPEDDATATKTIVNGHINIEFGIPKGEKGDPGQDGQDGQDGAPGTPATDAQVQTAVNAWLANNVDPDSGYVLDNTLTQPLAAAPADLVGEIKAGIAGEFNASYTYQVGAFVWYQGSLYCFVKPHAANDPWSASEVTVTGLGNAVRNSIYNVAPYFSESASYTAGEYVVYYNSLFKFTSDHAAGAWDASHVTAVRAMNEVSDLKSAFPLSDDPKYTVDNFVVGNFTLSGTLDTTVKYKMSSGLTTFYTQRKLTCDWTKYVIYTTYRSGSTWATDLRTADVTLNPNTYVFVIQKSNWSTADLTNEEQAEINSVVKLSNVGMIDYLNEYTAATVKWKRWLANTDDVFSLDPGVYGISNLAANKPTNLPSAFPATNIGYISVLNSVNGSTQFALLCAAYDKRFWVRTGYDWIEVTTSNNVNTLLAPYFTYMGVMPASTNIRTASKGLYALYPTSINAIVGLPNDYNGSNYGYAYVMQSSPTAPYILLFDGRNVWLTMAGGSWKRITINNSATAAKIAVIGDSITQHNTTATKNWVDLMEDAGFTMQNLGYGGSGFANPSDGDHRYINRIASIDNDVDLIGISSSFNDLATSLPVGSVSDTGSTSICGYINDFFDALIAAFPTTPICCYTLNPWGTVHYGQSATGTDYVDKFKEICALRGLPFLSLYTSSGMYPWIDANKIYYFTHPDTTVDSVHPNDEGHKLLFRKLLPHFMTCAKLADDFYNNPVVLNQA